MSYREFCFLGNPKAFLASLIGIAAVGLGCSAKKPLLVGNYQGTWNTEKHNGLLHFNISSDRSLIGQIQMDDTANSAQFLGGPVDSDGTFNLRIGGQDQMDGSMELDGTGIIRGHAVIKSSRHSINFVLRPAESASQPQPVYTGSETPPAKVQDSVQEANTQVDSQVSQNPAASNPTPSPTQRTHRYYAALLTRLSDMKQAYILWSQSRDGTQDEFEKKVMLRISAQFFSQNRTHCQLNFMGSERLPGSAVELYDFESVASFSNP